MSSSFIHFLVSVRISFLSLVSGYMGCFYIWLLRILLLWTGVCNTYLNTYFQFFWTWTHTIVDLMVSLCLNFWGPSILSSTMSALLSFLLAVSKGYCCYFYCHFMKAILLSVKWWFIVVRSNFLFLVFFLFLNY